MAATKARSAGGASAGSGKKSTRAARPEVRETARRNNSSSEAMAGRYGAQKGTSKNKRS